MELLGLPPMVLAGCLRVSGGGVVELLVLHIAEPRSMRDLAPRPIRRRQIGQMVQLGVASGGLEHEAHRNDLSWRVLRDGGL